MRIPLPRRNIRFAVSPIVDRFRCFCYCRSVRKRVEVELLSITYARREADRAATARLQSSTAFEQRQHCNTHASHSRIWIGYRESERERAHLYMHATLRGQHQLMVLMTTTTTTTDEERERSTILSDYTIHAVLLAFWILFLLPSLANAALSPIHRSPSQVESYTPPPTFPIRDFKILLLLFSRFFSACFSSFVLLLWLLLVGSCLFFCCSSSSFNFGCCFVRVFFPWILCMLCVCLFLFLTMWFGFSYSRREEV